MQKAVSLLFRRFLRKVTPKIFYFIILSCEIFGAKNVNLAVRPRNRISGLSYGQICHIWQKSTPFRLCLKNGNSFYFERRKSSKLDTKNFCGVATFRIANLLYLKKVFLKSLKLFLGTSKILYSSCRKTRAAHLLDGLIFRSFSLSDDGAKIPQKHIRSNFLGNE